MLIPTGPLTPSRDPISPPLTSFFGDMSLTRALVFRRAFAFFFAMSLSSTDLRLAPGGAADDRL